MSISVVYSPHDGGYYAEVWDVRTGETLHTTSVVSTHEKATKLAMTWMNLGVNG